MNGRMIFLNTGWMDFYKGSKGDTLTGGGTKFYRICIVINALVKPKLKIFYYSKDNQEWISDDGTTLNFEEVISARIYV